MSPNIFYLGLVSFLTDVSSEMINPILPLFIEKLGGGGMAIGLISGLGLAVASIFKILSGYWSDKKGERKKFVFIGYTLSAVGKVFFVLVKSWLPLVLLQPLERIGKGVRTPPRDALLADSVKEEKRGRGFGFHRAMDSAGAVLGSIIALILIWRFTPHLGQVGGYQAVFLVAAVVAFLALVPFLKVKDIKSEPKTGSLKITFKNLPHRLKIYILIATVFALGNFSYMFLILKSSQFFSGVDSNVIPIVLYIVFNISYTLLSYPIGAWSDKIGRRKILTSGYFLFALICLGFIFASGKISLFLLFIIYGLFNALVDASERAYVVDLAGPEWRGTALGSFHLAISLAALPSGLLAGFLWDLSASYTFIYGAVLAVGAGLGLTAMTRIKPA